jgi:hypothetical protein
LAASSPTVSPSRLKRNHVGSLREDGSSSPLNKRKKENGKENTLAPHDRTIFPALPSIPRWLLTLRRFLQLVARKPRWLVTRGQFVQSFQKRQKKENTLALHDTTVYPARLKKTSLVDLERLCLVASKSPVRSSQKFVTTDRFSEVHKPSPRFNHRINRLSLTCLYLFP